MKNKKGIQLGQAFTAVLTLILVAVLVIIGVFIFTSLGSSAPRITQSIVNEQGYINISGDMLNNATDCNFNNLAIGSVYNTTSGLIITSANYTVVNGRIFNATATVWPAVNISYTYTNGGGVCLATNNMVTNFTQYPTLVGLVGTIIFLGIVIGVLVASFALGGRRA